MGDKEKPVAVAENGIVIYPMGRTVRNVGFGAWDVFTPMRDENGEVNGSAHWKFREVERHKRKDLGAWMEVMLSRNGKEKVWSSRGVLTSTSFRSDAVRTLDRMFPDKNLAEYLADAVNLLESEMDNVGWDQGVFDAPPSREEKMLLGPFIASQSPNLFFGDGSSCKTYACLGMMASLALGTPFLGYRPTQKCRSLFLDYENQIGRYRDRLYNVAGSIGEPFDIALLDSEIRYLNCSGAPITDRLPRIREIIEKKNIELVVVDSALGACGGAPEDASVTGRYFEALNSLGVTTITIAHVSHGAMNQENPVKGQMHSFGSIFWRNYPRATWNIQKLGDENDEDKVKKLILYNRKANDGPIHRPVPVEVDFSKENIVSFRAGKEDDWEEAKPLTERILKFLKRGPTSRKTIDQEFQGEKPNTVLITLRRLKERGRVRQLGGDNGDYSLI